MAEPDAFTGATGEHVGIRLHDGPHDGHTLIYPLDWPPPDELLAFRVDGQVAICDVVHEIRARGMDAGVALYRKTGQSTMDEPFPGVIRGATYTHEADADPVEVHEA